MRAALVYAVLIVFGIGVGRSANAQQPSTRLSPIELLSPQNDSMGIRGDLTLIWQRNDSAAEYRVELSKYSTFDTSVVNDTIAARSYAVGDLDRLTTYYWRVRGIDGLGISGEWSTTWHFTTSRGKPLTPTQIFPEDRATEVAYRGLDLFWREDTLATSYALQLSRDSNFQTTVSNVTGLKANHATIDHLDSLTTYYWRVVGKNEEGTGEWSPIRSFTTKAPPLAVKGAAIQRDVTVYPNPASLILQVSNAEVAALSLTDILGHRFYLFTTGKGRFTVGQLPRGLYILQCLGSDGSALPDALSYVLLQ